MIQFLIPVVNKYLDLYADDILDEYLAPSKKPEAVTQLPIPEEGFSDE